MQTNKHDSFNITNYSAFVNRVRTSQLYQDPDKININNLLEQMSLFLRVYYFYQLNIPFIIQHIESRKIEDIVCNPGQIDDLIDFRNKNTIKSIVFDKYLGEVGFLHSQLFIYASMSLQIFGFALMIYNTTPKSINLITEALKIIATILSTIFIYDKILINIREYRSNDNILFLLSLIIIGYQFKILSNDFIKYTLISTLALNPINVQQGVFNLLYNLGVCNIPINSFILMTLKTYFKDLQTQHDNTQNDRPFSLQFFDKCHESGEFDEFLETRTEYMLK